MPKPLYEPKSGSPLSVDPSVYGPLASETASRTLSAEFIVPIRSGHSWTMLCAISTCPHGVEVYDVDPSLLKDWQTPRVSDYSGMHGLRSWQERPTRNQEAG